jgi:hypothetical protein
MFTKECEPRDRRLNGKKKKETVQSTNQKREVPLHAGRCLGGWHRKKTHRACLLPSVSLRKRDRTDESSTALILGSLLDYERHLRTWSNNCMDTSVDEIPSSVLISSIVTASNNTVGQSSRICKSLDELRSPLINGIHHPGLSPSLIMEAERDRRSSTRS